MVTPFSSAAATLRFHFFEKGQYRILGRLTGRLARPTAAGDDDAAAEFLHPLHLVGESGRTERIARAHTQFHAVLREQSGESRVAHLRDLLALIAVDAAPDVDCLAARLANSGKMTSSGISPYSAEERT